MCRRSIWCPISVLPPAEACRFLVDLANMRGGPDNTTVVIVRVGTRPDANGVPVQETDQQNAAGYATAWGCITGNPVLAASARANVLLPEPIIPSTRMRWPIIGDLSRMAREYSRAWGWRVCTEMLLPYMAVTCERNRFCPCGDT